MKENNKRFLSKSTYEPGGFEYEKQKSDNKRLNEAIDKAIEENRCVINRLKDKLLKEIKCHDCGKQLKEGDEYMDYKNGFCKCRDCHQKDSTLRNYRPCEVYARVVGYIRPVAQWNKGKQAEYKDRVEFVTN